MGYYAFISYCHYDISAVRKFHKKLEGFSIPAIIRKQVSNCPRNLFPIFRDETDLSGVTLTPMIEEALAQSEYLIVICTANSACSAWVEQEINFFLNCHSPDCIIPVFLDNRMKRACKNGFFGTLAGLNGSLDNCVSYTSGRLKKARFEIVARTLGCCSPQLLRRYASKTDILWLLQLFLWVFLIVFIFTDINWLYKEKHDITKYCRDIAFSYDWPEAVDPLNAVTRLFADDYYICTYHLNRIIRIERVSSGSSEIQKPGMFLLESDCMEFKYNNYWRSDAQVSQVVFKDKEDNILFVKNFSLEHYIVDLTKTTDSGEPFYLPEDMTFSNETVNGEAQGRCRLFQLYNDAGQIAQIWFVSDTFSYHACDINGYYGMEFEYSDSGELVSVKYLDLDGSVLAAEHY